MPIIALDTFNDIDKNLVDHTPDSGFGSWTYGGNPADWRISGNKAKKENIADNLTRFCRCDLDLIDDELEVRATFTRSSGGEFAGERHGLYLLAHKTTAITVGEGVEAFLIRQTGSQMTFRIIRRDSVGVEQQNALLATISIAAGASLDFGATVNGLDVEGWTEPAGGGSRTVHGMLTLDVDLRDGNHKRLGITGRTESNAPRATLDDLSVLAIVPPAGQVQIPASMQSAFSGRVQVSSLIVVKRLVPESDQFSPGVHFDGLNPRFYRGSSFQRRDS